MQRLLLPLAAALMLSAATTLALGQAAASTTSQASEAEREVRQMIKKYRQALLKRDVAALERIWADDYTFINAGGKLLSKADRLANLRSGATALRLANLRSGATALGTIKSEDEPVVRVYGDAAVAISRVTLAGRYSGRATSGAFRSMNVWAKRQGRWQLVANQQTRITGQ
jgi:ketosteroid isomerase-like protein